MSSEWHGGKGSSQRKMDKQKYSDNWDRIFGNKESKEVQNNENGERKQDEIQTIRE